MDVIVLAALSLAVLFLALGQNDHWASREIRHAEIMREMAVDGDFLVPHCLGQVYIDKPPVFHWLGAAVMKWSGRPTLFAARLPSALAGALGVFLTYALGRLLLDRAAALIGAVALLAMPNYVIMGRSARPDMFLAIAVLGTCVASAMALRQGQGCRTMDKVSRRDPGWRRTGFWLAAGMAAGLGVLAKGPYGILFPLIFLICMRLAPGRWFWPKWEWALFLAGTVGVLAAWVIPIVMRGQGDYLRSLLTQRDLTTGASGHARSFFWYVGPLAITAMPMILFLPCAVRKWRQCGYSVMLATAAGMFLLLSCVPGKRNHYLLPLFPFLALGLADAILFQAGRSVWVRRAALILIPLFLLSHIVYFTALIKLFNPGGDPEFQFAGRVAQTVRGQIVCQDGIQESLAWMQRRFDNLHWAEGRDISAKAGKFGPGAFLILEGSERAAVLRRLRGRAGLREIFAAPPTSKKKWVLFQITNHE